MQPAMSQDVADGASLVVAGETTCPGTHVEMTQDAAQPRAVVRCTGTSWERGQVATSHNDDGSYRHEFTLPED